MLTVAAVKSAWINALAVRGVRVTVTRPAVAPNPAKTDTNVRAKYGLAGATADLAGGLKVTQHEISIYYDDLKNLQGLQPGDRVVFEGRQGTVAKADNTSGRIFGVPVVSYGVVEV